jgi:hypothetical protein
LRRFFSLAYDATSSTLQKLMPEEYEADSGTSRMVRIPYALPARDAQLSKPPAATAAMMAAAGEETLSAPSEPLGIKVGALDLSLPPPLTAQSYIHFGGLGVSIPRHYWRRTYFGEICG